MYDLKEEAINTAKKCLMQKSDELGKTKNKWRKINENTIEVKTCNDINFFIDLKNEYLLKKAACYTRKVHNKDHVLQTINGKQIAFAKIIKPNAKIIEY